MENKVFKKYKKTYSINLYSESKHCEIILFHYDNNNDYSEIITEIINSKEGK